MAEKKVLTKNELRLKTLRTVITDSETRKKLDESFAKAGKGNWPAMLKELKKTDLKEPAIKKIEYIQKIASITDDDVELTRKLAKESKSNNLREIALKHDKESLKKIIDPKKIPDTIPGKKEDEKKRVDQYAEVISTNLYLQETSAVIHRMINSDQIPIKDINVRKGLCTLFANQPDFDIRRQSVYQIINKEESFKGIKDVHKKAVIAQLKTLQRVQAICPNSEALPVLMNKGFWSSQQVSETSEKAFIKRVSADLGEDVAKQIYTNAINNKIRIEQALMAMRENMQGTGVAAIDGKHDLKERMKNTQAAAEKHQIPLNWETLFGSADLCECDECNSVYSPAAYFVELLQYLRNNNLDEEFNPDGTPKYPNTGNPGIENTPLEKLFRRRPDLGCLELTCKNANTVLPYIDLANEVMESFVVHKNEYGSDTHNPKQAKIDVFNIEDEISSELMAQPQHTNYMAYCLIKQAKYPFTLPYHQPIDAARIFLNYLKTSRYELMKRFRTGLLKNQIDEEIPRGDDVDGNGSSSVLTENVFSQLAEFHEKAIDRALDGEYLGLIQEEYIILTKQAFWEKEYFEIKCGHDLTESEYQEKIRLGDVFEYYGYKDETQMLSLNENAHVGLTFVKEQFLKRTGILYTDLVELLKTQFINPNYPRGKALTIFEKLRFSYRFMQSMVDYSITDPQVRFGKLIEYLEKFQPIIPYIDEILHPDPCKSKKTDTCVEMKDLKKWVYCCFEKVGKIIVLESVYLLRIERPLKPDSSGELKTELVGYLNKDNIIIETSGVKIGEVRENGEVYNAAGGNFTSGYGCTILIIKTDDNNIVGYIQKIKIKDYLKNSLYETVNYIPIKETCDLGKIRLQHLDGSGLIREEYDNIHRFIRLWRRIGWTIDELDKAIIGLAGERVESSDPELPGEENCFEGFEDNCECGDQENACCPEDLQAKVKYDITPEFLHQLVAVKKLLEKTGLEVIKLLTFWCEISTRGEKSLYKRLFLTHNLLSVDKVFKADEYGNYLLKPEKITDHMPVLMAALNLKSEDIDCIRKFKDITDELNIENVSMLYRHSLLAKLLHVKLLELKNIVALFNDPFINADRSLSFFKTWEKMENAGFTARELSYIIIPVDDEAKPLTPAKKTILQSAITIYDGLNAIKKEHPDDITKEEEATSEKVRGKASLIFDPDVTECIIGLLEGTTIYQDIAPVNLVDNDDKFLTKLNPELTKKLKYNFRSGSIQVIGVLNEAAMAAAKAVFTDPGWGKALDRIAKKPLIFYRDVLQGVFPKPEEGVEDEAKKILLKADINIPDTEQDPAHPVKCTAPEKRFYFIRHFLPYMRERLSCRFLVETLSGSFQLEKELTEVLISRILEDDSSKQSFLKVFRSVAERTPQSGSKWSGYLIPAAEDEYQFVVENITTPIILLDGQSLDLKQPEDSENIWFSEAQKLISGKPYQFEVTGLDADLKKLRWKTETSLPVLIPQNLLLLDYLDQPFEKAYIKLYKVSIILNGFGLKAVETVYIHQHASDFDDMNFNRLKLVHWEQLQSFVRLRDSLPQTDTNLIEFFTWVNNPADRTGLENKIAKLTNWKEEKITNLIRDDHFKLNKIEEFKNEKNLLKLQKALYVADKINMDIDLLFEWAKPESRFWKCHEVAESIKNSIEARYKQDDWERVVKPLNDQLRTNQRIALVNYLLVQQPIIDWPVTDDEGLFEFFLIDVKMESVMETSRIKQAISSVQLFIQRCLLGLEDKKDDSGNQVGVTVDALDRDRWDWMQRNNVWVANRKVFLYPENWIEPELRDDKSPFFKELESALLQKDINPDTVKDALKDYVYKVDEVANMRVVGLFVEKKDEFGNEHNRIHVFSRTRNAPYFFYYRYYEYDYDEEKKSIKGGYWYPWEKVQVDIPSYDVEEVGEITHNGSYLIPVVWNNRSLIFFPQFMKKSIPREIKTNENGNEREAKLKEIADKPVSEALPEDVWEIKMAWSEYRNNKWTQKQVSTGAFYKNIDLKKICGYKFTLSISDENVKIILDLKRTYQYFKFSNNILAVETATGPTDIKSDTCFNYENDKIKYYHHPNPGGPYPECYDDDNKALIEIDESWIKSDFYNAKIHNFIGEISSSDLKTLFKCNISNDYKNFAFGQVNNTATYNELYTPFAIYNWELFFHASTLLADKLSKSQQFEEAMKWFHYVFDPYAEDKTDVKRFWRFFPFHETDADNYLEVLFNSLQPNQYKKEISDWRDKPFRPHLVARSRPVAYMKWVVMKYLDNLIDWADYLFRQYTIETMNQATQLYILAYHILGPKPQVVPRRGKIKSQTYLSLLDKWDAFGNAMVEMEILFPNSNQISLPLGVSNGLVGFANIFGFASSLYFCIPNNPKLLNYWSTIEDRLFKIRHCLTIEGIFSIPALWDPPIDPALLVQAVAQGLSISSVLNDLNSPMPNYRFNYLLQKAFELCNELKSMGNALLSALEKKDAEALSNMRVKHESSINNLVMKIKEMQQKEAEKALEGLDQNRKAPVYRLQHYLKLIGEDLNKIPAEDSDFAELANQIEAPIDESGLKLIKYEKEEMDKAHNAADMQKQIGQIETLASILHLIPQLSAEVCPIGVGAAIAFGGQFLGNAAQAVAKYMQIGASELSYQSSSAGRKGGFLRQLQDRVYQANLAGYEIKQIDKQILSQKIRIDLANQEITNQQQQIENIKEVEDYMKNKYTNEELYSWMIGSIKTLYHQVYTLAYDIAKKTEKAYGFERGISSSNFIQFGYWDASRDGLQAGERLYVGLKRLETAYQENRGYDYEITKHISLRQLNPVALIELREKGKCEFALPEVLFDMDYPGHYMRRIKSVALSIPCVVGPYTSVNCTLRLLANEFRKDAIPGNSYPKKMDETDERFSTFNIPITSIAISSGQNDSGVFELNFKDERYVPFEGAGAISKWRLELPEGFRQFDYNSISDIIMHLRYTTKDGGDSLKTAAVTSVEGFIKSVEELSQQEGLFAAFDLTHDFPSEWYKACNPPADAEARLLTLGNLSERLPVFTKSKTAKATDLWLFSSLDTQFSLVHDTSEDAIANPLPIGTNKKIFHLSDLDYPMSDWQIKIADKETKIEALWLIMRYKLK